MLMKRSLGPLLLGQRHHVVFVGDIAEIGWHLGAKLLDGLARDAVLAELRLDHATSTGRMTIALFEPPASECEIIKQLELSELANGDGDDPRTRLGSLQTLLDLPLAAWAYRKKASGDLEGALRPGRLWAASRSSWLRPTHSETRYSASLIPSTPTSMDDTLPRISSSILPAISALALKKSRAFSRPWPSRVSP
jgi:hypothetical protein